MGRHCQRQSALLESTSAHVYPGGYLAYSTCSLENEENQDVVRKFLENHKDFETVPLTLPPLVKDVEILPEGLLIWPTTEHDGGFLSLLLRKA